MTTLTERAEALLAYAKQVDGFLAAKKRAPPSFDADELADLPAEQQAVRERLIGEVDTFRSLVRGPTMNTMEIAFNWTDALPLRVIYEFRLAQAVPLDGSASYADIAAAVGLKEELVRRYLRAAMGNHIFAEDGEGRVRHTAISRLLATDTGVQDAVGLQTVELGPSAPHVAEAWKQFGQDAFEPHETAWTLANGTDDCKSVFQVLGAQPDRARRFGGAMHFFTADETWDLRHLLTAYDWAALDKPETRIVDVGGGFGQVAQYLAKNTQHAHFVVQDLPHNADAAGASLPEELRSRISFAAHDFFTPQPAEPATTVFFLRWILHDWSDHHAAKILASLVPAMRPGTKVLLHEYLLPPHPDTTLSGRFGFQLDLIMATNFNGKERTRAQFADLLHQADPRFVLDDVHRPEGSTMSLVEVSWKG